MKTQVQTTIYDVRKGAVTNLTMSTYYVNGCRLKETQHPANGPDGTRE